MTFLPVKVPPCAGCGARVTPADGTPAFADSVVLCTGCAFWWHFAGGVNDDPLHIGCLDFIERGQ